MYGFGAPTAPYAGTMSLAQVNRLTLALAELAHVYFHATWKADAGRAAIALKVWKEFFRLYQVDIVKAVRSVDPAAATAIEAQIPRMTPTATMDAGTGQVLPFMENIYFRAPLVFQALARILLGQDPSTTVSNWYQTKYAALFTGDRRSISTTALLEETGGLAQASLENAYINYVRIELDTAGIRVVSTAPAPAPAPTPVMPGSALPPVPVPASPSLPAGAVPGATAIYEGTPFIVHARNETNWLAIGAGVAAFGLASYLAYFLYSSSRKGKRR